MFLPLWDSLTLSPLGPRSSWFTDEVMTSKYLSCSSRPRGGEVHHIASSLEGEETRWGGASMTFGSSTRVDNILLKIVAPGCG